MQNTRKNIKKQASNFCAMVYQVCREVEAGYQQFAPVEYAPEVREADQGDFMEPDYASIWEGR